MTHALSRGAARSFARSASFTALVALSALACAQPGCVQTTPDTDPSAQDDSEAVGVAEEALGLPNLAFGKVATQSSTFQGYGASRAVDGNTDGNFNVGSVSHTNNDAAPYAYWQVDLGSPQALGTMLIHNRTDGSSERLSNFKVQTSTDGYAFSDVLTFPGTVAKQVQLNLNVTAQWVRIRLNSQNYLHMAEVKIFPQAKPTNLALGRLAEQSSTLNNDGLASHATDGNTNGSWTSWSVTHTQSESMPWWQVDLGSKQPIGTVVLYNRTDCCSDRLTNFRLQVSDDKASWTTVANYPGTAPAKLTLRPLDASGNYAQGRYLRVQLNGTNYLSLAEVEVVAPTVYLDPANPFKARYALASRENGRVLTTSNGSVYLDDWSAANGQFWRFKPASDGRYELQALSNGTTSSFTDGSYLVYTFGGPIPQRTWWTQTSQSTPLSSQLFRLEDAGGGFFNVISPNLSEYLEGGGSLALWPWTSTLRQYWRVFPAPSVSNDDEQTARMREDALSTGLALGAAVPYDPVTHLPILNIAEPPQLTVLQALPLNEDVSETVLGDTPIPYFAVNDPLRNRAAQVQQSPYYRLRRSHLWRRKDSWVVAANVPQTHQSTWTYGTSSTVATSVEQKTSISIQGSASFNFSGAGVSLQYSVTKELSVSKSESTGVSEEHSVSDSFTHEASEPARAYALYVPVDRYTVTDANNAVIVSWDYPHQTGYTLRAYP